ncbi:UDP-N-acetylglucosamine 1-carboxyvinyltransferase [Candidatus Saccharibacteria bacterium]|nr:UDP-N-acetylglucosamine 1-carboxyvinyltransferase [Candidatus Saccharibacteria bacterium]
MTTTKAKTPSKDSYQAEIGALIARLRQQKGLTQTDLAKLAGTSQSAIHRIEAGRQNISLDMIGKLSHHLGGQILSVNDNVSQSYRINGGHQLAGTVTVNTSKNAAVALLCASLLNQGKTTLRHVARIEEVFRIIEVLESIGVKCRWINHNKDLEIISPRELKIKHMNLTAARRTRSIIMFLGPLLHAFQEFQLPYAGGCALGVRTVDPHVKALSVFGLEVDAVSSPGFYLAKRSPKALQPHSSSSDTINYPDKRLVLIERGDTVTENVLMAAALYPGRTTIVGASSNYMVQDLCFFLQKLGVKIAGIGTTTLTVIGKKEINENVEYSPAEDPIEAMSFIAAALVTHSEITIKRAPIEFLEIELEILHTMHANILKSPEYKAVNGRTRLVDLTVKQSTLIAPADKIHPMPFPGLNIDNLPFFSVIAATAKGRTLIHDWVFENRAIYVTELANLNAKVELLDAHRVYVEGPTNWRPAEMVAPPALRPAVVILIAMLAAPGTSILRNVYPINRGYQDFAARLSNLGADIAPLAGL